MIDPACAQKNEPRLSAAAVFEEVDRATEVVLDELSAARLSVGPRQGTLGLAAASMTQSTAGRLSRSEGQRISPWRRRTPLRFQGGAVGFTAGANEIIDTQSLQPSINWRSEWARAWTHKSTDAGDEDLHGFRMGGLSFPLLPCFDDFREDIVEAFRDFPCRIMGFHFPQVAVVADVVALTVFIGVGVDHLFPTECFRAGKGLEHGAAIGFTTPEVVDFPAAGGL